MAEKRKAPEAARSATETDTPSSWPFATRQSEIAGSAQQSSSIDRAAKQALELWSPAITPIPGGGILKSHLYHFAEGNRSDVDKWIVRLFDLMSQGPAAI